MNELKLLLSVKKLVKHFPIMKGTVFQKQVGAVYGSMTFPLKSMKVKPLVW